MLYLGFSELDLRGGLLGPEIPVVLALALLAPEAVARSLQLLQPSAPSTLAAAAARPHTG